MQLHTLLPILLPVLTIALTPRQTTAASQLLLIAPTSSTCTTTPYPPECATNTQAAPHLISSFRNHSITSPPIIAALLSLIAFETGDFKYSINHFPSPGRPGQGTRNMQVAKYNLLYARSFPELMPKVEGIVMGRGVEELGREEVDAVRALVLPDEYSWGSAAWFLVSQCGKDVMSALETPGVEGFGKYMGCVETTVTSDRLAYYTRALQAFGLSFS